MALVNAGVQLAEKGKKVLLVDFDLEAPGLTSFEMGRSHTGKRGIVEYVREYLTTNVAPNAEDYCYPAKRFPSGGEIWIMPSGVGDRAYPTNLNAIDWGDLYSSRDGYLLFEDLRTQWSRFIGAEYVLIDSRTGHSDVEGICTRQLPDAVCFLFFPNEQNLEGLKRVNELVRRQNRIGRQRRRGIVTHFAVSNVPELDDEDGILRNTLSRFKSDLGYKSLAAQIHHYQSLSLLNQDVFSLTRPNSRLTREYSKLVQSIVKENLQDRDVAIERLNQMSREVPDASQQFGKVGATEFVETLQQILGEFPTDPEVRLRSALAYEAIGETKDALDLLTPETAEGSKAPALAYATRARLLSRRNESEQAVKALQKMLDSKGADLSTVLDALSLLTVLAPELFEHVGISEVVRALEPGERYFVATQCEADVHQLHAQIDILTSLLQTSTPEDILEPGHLRSQLAVAKIGYGDFDAAIADMEQNSKKSASIADKFNLAMAKWGAYGRHSALDLLSEVLVMHESSGSGDRTPNYLECLAITNLLLGRREEGYRFIQASRREMNLRHRREFSAWSYLRVDAERFLTHLNAIENILDDKDLVPEFVERSQKLKNQKFLFQ